MTIMPWTLEPVSNNVHVIRFREIAAGWEQYVLLSSDRHHDNADCNTKLERQHLEIAKQRQAPIIDGGDLFDAMQSKFDPRSNKSELKDEHKRRDYTDALIEHAAEFYGPYAENFSVIGLGNHETQYLDRHGTNLCAGLASRLNADYIRSDHRVCSGGYGGWVLFRFHINGTQQQTLRLKYYHGSGGAAPVTKGVIDTNRMAVFLPDADIIMTGHSHTTWHVPLRMERITGSGKIYKTIQHHVRTPGYKDDYGDGSTGFAIERLGKTGPKPIGAVWLRFYLSGSRIKVEPTLAIE